LADEEMSNIIVANLILSGAVTRETGFLSVASMEKAIETKVHSLTLRDTYK
jgi:hypothetical protein